MGWHNLDLAARTSLAAETVKDKWRTIIADTYAKRDVSFYTLTGKKHGFFSDVLR